MKHAFGVLLIIVPWGFVSHLAKLELHFPGFLSSRGPGLGLAMREVCVGFGRWSERATLF